MNKESIESKAGALSEGNRLFREGSYREAIDMYRLAMSEIPALADQLDFNIRLAHNLIDSKGGELRSDGAKNGGHSPRDIKNVEVRKKSNGIPLVSGYGYECKVEKFTDGSISGWAVNKDIPGDVFNLKIKLNGVDFISIKNDLYRGDLFRLKKSTGRGGFSVSFPKNFIANESCDVSIELPSGLIVNVGKLEGEKELSVDDLPYVCQRNNVTVIVPIFNAVEDVQVCIERLIKYTSRKVKVILINDASTDDRIVPLLEAVAGVDQFTVMHNEINLGFTRTVNRGIDAAGKDDVVLLNSDARVTPRWLEGMQRAVMHDSRIATVTPMSDRAGAFSAPKIGNENELPEGISESDYAVTFRRFSKGVYPSVPTGNGFCMYIRRDCLNDVGALDSEAFPRGYGEENDFCMRARQKGWRHVIDDRTYVFHDRSKSFGEAKADLIKAGRKVVDLRFPDYKKSISVFTQSPLLALARYRAGVALRECANGRIGRPRALFVVATNTGGTPQTNRDLMLALSGSWEPWLLHCDSKVISLYRVRRDADDELVRQFVLSEPVEPLTHISFEYDRVVNNWLSTYDFDLVHIRHIAWHSMNLPAIAKRWGAKVVKSFHDFYAICPTTKLLDDKNNFCGGECSGTAADCSIDLWSNKDALPRLKNAWISSWREKFQDALSCVDAFVTTHVSVKDTISQYIDLGAKRFDVIEHGRDFQSFESFSATHVGDGPLRILIPGSVGVAKGSELIQSLIDIDTEGHLEFHVLGKISLPSSERLINHGSYMRDEFATRVKEISPHIGAVFSIWNETWCHTLTELWSVGVPVAALNFQTLKGRIDESNAGWVFDLTTPEDIYKMLVQIKNDPVELSEKLKRVAEWQASIGAINDTAYMAKQYDDLYHSIS